MHSVIPLVTLPGLCASRPEPADPSSLWWKRQLPAVCAYHRDHASADSHQLAEIIRGVKFIMPKKDGLEVITEIRRRYPNTRIIAISGGARPSGPGVLATAQALGADGLLAKPFRQEALLDMVDELMQSK